MSDVTNAPSNEMSPDDRADLIIGVMVSGSVAAAAAPVGVSWVLFTTALCTGVVGLGSCYDTTLESAEAWKVVKQLFVSAGLIWLGLSVGAKIIAAILQLTGLGYIAAVALDSAVSGALAYAVGKSAQAYFKGERDKEALGRAFRNAFAQQRAA